ncbi:hypothetical protein [Cupriavidus taiwanensis]|nr:hypothetical protein [Cupriavidus taiwanensis]SOY56858.1 conserved hypothetical protein [Cupriavidus taiwanensis]SOY90798.1 conserved hypothetical protein [Cupriavidus taiwanensis]SOZ63581.1 conserved hypothetical protein [Cupriavidus taiwanensis]SOZ82608.1 conserved hypothetical protein [Cupriavidus taiwanensis]SOZ84450.1 conserved hypothetical protein [Cupriavidus taiwanensis]
MPYDVAFSYTDAERFAACVVFRELEGATFDWEAMSYKDRP